LGILGGGQLGRMLAMAAARLGFHAHAYDPAPASPAFEVCAGFTCAPWDDSDALRAFARAVDVVTFEFENVPPERVDLVEALAPIRPGAARSPPRATGSPRRSSCKAWPRRRALRSRGRARGREGPRRPWACPPS
jgi:hypothetical protein